MSQPTTTPGDDEHKLAPTRIRDLLAVAVVAGALLYVTARYYYGSFPSLPWLAGLMLYIVAVLLVVVAFLVRARVAAGNVGPAPGQLHPINVARAFALARASALLGAIAVGGWLGLLVFLLGRRYLDVAVADTPATIVGAIGGVFLVAAALWLEHCCRTPDDPTPEPSVPSADPA
ncbi:MAG: DUF3180 domain-containing protein [Gordonia sp. (in: high G+C Gram-positive bacteria)]|uniref:DUF3180 domain-containing protein n=1 Tax=Gordonia sp. (in: high G+C Gram-positive bacteria) TaxID=84139 RepID=UPI003BB57115